MIGILPPLSVSKGSTNWHILLPERSNFWALAKLIGVLSLIILKGYLKPSSNFRVHYQIVIPCRVLTHEDSHLTFFHLVPQQNFKFALDTASPHVQLSSRQLTRCVHLHCETNHFNPPRFIGPDASLASSLARLQFFFSGFQPSVEYLSLCCA